MILPKVCAKTNKPKLSYSQTSSWEVYKDNYIKQYFAGIKLPQSPYAEFGNKVGVARETGDYSNFSKQEQEILNSIERVANTQYEYEILLDMGEFVVQGFIDELVPTKDGYIIIDNKTGGKDKMDEYRSIDYLQTVIYRMALEQQGLNVVDTQVRFFGREGSHIKPPMVLSGYLELIPIEYNQQRVDYAIAKLHRVASEISLMYKAYKELL